MMKWKTVYLFFLCILTVNVEEISSKKRVCVIGAGVSGLNSLKQMAMNVDEFDPVVYEKNSDVGGLWNYRQDTEYDEHGLPGYTGMYKNLRTNFPKELMAFPDYQDIQGENRSYITHKTIADYMKNYTDHFNLRQYIKFNTLVKNVKPILDSCENNTKWNLETQNLDTNKSDTTKCDAVVVCNGHFNKPYIPTIPGIENFHGRILHSVKYREPEDFTNQTVVLLGGSWSGMDIGMEIRQHAKKTYLSHRHKKIQRGLPDDLIQVAGVVSANENELILSDGKRIAADALIYCTGYLYDYPFLDSSSGVIVTDGKYVHPLYKHLINIEHPTMAFLNLPYPGLPFLFAHGQSVYFRAVLQGKVKLPSREEMLKDAELPAGRPASKAHYMFEDNWIYYDNLTQDLPITPLPSWYRTAYDAWYEQIIHDVLHFKERDLRIHEDGHAEFVERNK